MSRVAIGLKRPLLLKSLPTTPATSNAGGPEPCQPNGTTAIGVAASLPSVITTLNPCDSATGVSSAHSAATEAIHPTRALVFTTSTITTPLLDWTEKQAATHLSGAKVRVNVREKTAWLGGFGNGDAASTA